jgi:4-amino-4-deoxy-L-arabinose transferase-like glycosyltransferase
MDYYLHPWDEAYHALAAKNLLHNLFIPTLFEHPVFNYDYTDWSANHIWVHKPPLTLWLIMVSLKLFGINEIAVRLPSIILSSIGIFLTYYIAKQFYNEKVGLLASFFYAINGVLIELATGRNHTDHPEILFVFFVELGIFLSVYYLKHRSWFVISLIGVATGCALLTKWLPGLIIVGFLFILLIETMFHCNFTAYPFIPSKEQITIASEKGYSVFIMDSPNIPSDIRNIKNITFLKN